MSLTNDDLKAIGTLIDEKLDQKLDEKLAPIKDELKSHGVELKSLSKSVKYLKSKVNRIDKTVDIIGRTYDERIVANTRDIDQIKDHLGFPPKL